jgi:hypothetical protein
VKKEENGRGGNQKDGDSRGGESVRKSLVGCQDFEVEISDMVRLRGGKDGSTEAVQALRQ